MYDPNFSELQQVNILIKETVAGEPGEPNITRTVLEHRISKSFKDDYLFLDVLYKEGKYAISKTFTNNLDGKDSLEKTINQFNTEEKVRQYFGL